MNAPSKVTPVIGAVWLDRDRRSLNGGRRVTIEAITPADDTIVYRDGIRSHRSRLSRFVRAFRPENA